MRGFARQQRIIGVMVLLSLLLTVMVSTAFAQEDNICRNAGAPVIEFGETLTGTLDPDIPFAFFCFDAERGTDVTITVEHVSANLETIFFVTTPFIDSEGMLADEIMFAAESLDNTEYDGTVSIDEDGTYLIAVQGAQNVQGTFLVTLEESGGLVLGGNTDVEPTTEPESDNTGDDTPDEDEPLTTEIIPGQTNLCETVFSVDLAIGDTAEDSTDVQPIFYCIEANANEIVTIEFTIEDTVAMGFLVVDPLFDFTQNSFIYAQGIAQPGTETVSGEFLAPADGQYIIYVAAAEEAIGSFSMSVSSVAGNVYTCLNEPLGTLISREWGVVDSNGETVLQINVACSERLAISTLGTPAQAVYSVTQEDEFVFAYNNALYVTESLSETEWVIRSQADGASFTLEALTDEDTCSDENLLQLIQGSWLWQLDQTQSVFFDFTCNGVVIIDDGQTDPLITSYTFEDDQIVISTGEEPLIFSNILLEDEAMTITFSGIVFELENTLFNPDAGSSNSDVEATEEATTEVDSD